MVLNRIVGFGVAYSLAAAGWAQGVFTPIDTGTNSNATGLGISADGQYVVGGVVLPGQGLVPYRWSAGSGLLTLPRPAGSWEFGEATDVSDDGQTIVANWRVIPFVPEAYRAFRWNGSYQALQPLSGLASCSVNRASGNASVMAGWSAPAQSAAVEGTKWTSGVPAGAGIGPLFDISRDGTVSVGQSTATSSIYHAVRWSGAGVQDLGVLPGHVRSVAMGISHDGGTIVGMSESNASGSGTGHAFRWTQAGGMQDMGFLAGHYQTNLRAINDTGTIAIGHSILTSSGGARIPTIWTAEGGFARADLYLLSHGANLAGWTINELTAMSADGGTILGFGTFAVAPGVFQTTPFLISIPAPGPVCAVVLASAMAPRRRRVTRL